MTVEPSPIFDEIIIEPSSITHFLPMTVELDRRTPGYMTVSVPTAAPKSI